MRRLAKTAAAFALGAALGLAVALLLPLHMGSSAWRDEL